jgi:hypothetical protein
MGIDAHGARFLAYARSLGVEFGQTAMIGRQGLYVTPAEMRRILVAFGAAPSEAEVARICCGAEGYAERYLEQLGALAVHSFDYSDFEAATFVHDMNTPIPDEYAERYSVVLDGGSLEHIFDFPTAIRNCMQMTRVGGHYLAITPANNFLGHGFYQFSPELYFSVLSPENGFEIERMLAFEDRPDAPWYAVKNPREVRGRVTLTNAEPVFLLVIARRLARVPIFAHPPQQSDYLARWSPDEATATTESASHGERPLPVRIAKAVLPAAVRQSIRKALERPPRPRRGFDPQFFERMDPQPGAGGRAA